MKPHVHDAGDGWFYHLGSTCKQTFCFLAAHLIVGSIFVEGLVRCSVTVVNTLIEASHYMHLQPSVNTRPYWYNTFEYYQSKLPEVS